MSLAEKCLLASKCKKTDSEVCDILCFPYRKLHGDSGHGGLYGLSNIPKSYSKVTSENLPFAKENPTAFTIIKRYSKDVVSNVEKAVGLFLYSIPNDKNRLGTGTGKTTGACAVANDYIVARSIQSFKTKAVISNIPALFVNVSKFQNMFNAQFRGTNDMKEEASRKYYQQKLRMTSCDLLILDDIGVRDSTDSFKSEFYEMIDGRVIEKRATILTSNIELAEIANRLDERIASRIEGSTFPVSFEGEDKRKGGLFK